MYCIVFCVFGILAVKVIVSSKGDFVFVHSDGVVSMGEYMSFMISRETENVGSSQEVINAFKALTEGGKRLYVTEAELYQVNDTVG